MIWSIPPVISRQIVFPVHERLLGRPTFPYLAEIEASQWSSREAIEALQLRKLAALLGIANAHCPWHAERLAAIGLDTVTAQASLTRSDLGHIPTMDRTDAQLHRERMSWRDVPGGASPYNTGGSSGQPLQFYYGRARQASDAAGRMRARRWWGIEMGQREVYLWGAPVELSKTDVIKRFRDRLMNQLLLDAFAMSPTSMDNYLTTIEAFDPVCLYGYASSLALLAAHAQEHRRRPKLRSLKLVCTTGEPLYAHQRATIGEVFKVPVANEFGSRDAGFIAHESPAGQMLVLSESTLLEVLDPQGHPVAPGETGEAVITGLCSDAQPFIRYRTGDMLSLSKEACRQGRGLHVIDHISGRSTDFIVAPDGRILHALSVIYIVRAIDGVGEFKIIQHTQDSLEVRIVPNARWREANLQAIQEGFRQRLGDTVEIEILLVDEIAPEASGKHRYVVSHVVPYS